MVYADDTAAVRFEVLSEDALERRVWHEYNCQTYHQIHGFGGFSARPDQLRPPDDG